jgi:N-acetylglucosaminyl-diphospho-decaprenol L-rhamnosyltransferase
MVRAEFRIAPILACVQEVRTPRTASIRGLAPMYGHGVHSPQIVSESQPQLEGEALPDATVDAVVVSYRSAATLRGCVEPLTGLSGVRVTVVDNASPDNSVDTVADLPVDLLRSPHNGGFSYGCNLGAARGSAPFILFLNPDARMGADALAGMLDVMRAEPDTALVGPRIVEDGDELAWSLRRFPRHRSTFAQAVFAHRLLPRSAWTDELIRDPAAYDERWSPDWVSGACMLVRRDAFEQIGGFDERFFLYCEDTDLCRRLWDAGHVVRFEPAAEVSHMGGASSEPGETRAVAARSRVLYAQKHMGRARARFEATGVALGEATRAVAKLRRSKSRRSHVGAMRAALSPRDRSR